MSVKGWAQAIGGAARDGARAKAEDGPPPPPKDLTGDALDLWLIEQEIVETRHEMHRIRMAARAGASTHGLGQLGKRLDELLEKRRRLRPPAPPTKDDEERDFRAAAAEAVAIVRADVEKYEAEAAEKGICVHCKLPLDRGKDTP